MSINSQIAFTPLGKTIVVAADAAAPAGIQAPVYDKFEQQSTGQYRLINAGATTVFLGFGANATDATANAVAPIAGTPSAAIVLVPGAVEVLRFNQNTFFSGLSSAAATVYIVPGQGI